MSPLALAGFVEESRLLACIHCGLCLPTCPTYAESGNEADSPRGRIYFMRALHDGRIDLTDQVKVHLDRCLACFACETACPSGVRYRELIEDARGWLTVRSPSPAPPGWRWFFRRILPSARALRWALAPLWFLQLLGLRAAATRIARRLPLSWAGRSLGLLPARLPAPRTAPLAELLPARGTRRMRVGLLTGCVMEGFLPELNRLQAEILRELGCEVVVPRGQGCCGALALHAGKRELFAELGRGLVRVFAETGVDAIVASAAGCGSAMKDYGHLLGKAGFAELVRDFSELAAELARERPPTRPVRLRVAYQEACHLSHGQKVTGAPRALLRLVPGLELVELAEQELCCGSAGVYNILQPGFAEPLGRRKAAHAAAAGVDAVVTANPGCLLQLRKHLAAVSGAPRLLHLAEVVAAGYGLGSPV